MAAPRCLQCVKEGAHIRTPWSAHVVIKDILVTTQVGPWVFYGVCAETLDATSSDWTSPDCLLWVFDDASGPRMWQDTAQPSPFNSEDPEKNFDQIVGHYESNDGECYLAVKWKSCLAPTWERETDMVCCSRAITQYFTELCTWDLLTIPLFSSRFLRSTSVLEITSLWHGTLSL